MGVRFSAPVQTGPGAHPMGTGSFTEVKSGRGVTLTPHPLLVPWSRKSRAKPLHPLWAVLPVQSPSACTRVHFTFTLPICKERKAVGQKPKSVSALRKAICRLLWQNCVSLTSTSIKQNKINIIEPAFVSQNTQH